MSTSTATSTVPYGDTEFKADLIEKLTEVLRVVQADELTDGEESVSYEPLQSGPMTRWNPTDFHTKIKFKDHVSGQDVTVTITTKIASKPSTSAEKK